MSSGHLLGVAEIAEILGVSRQRVDQLVGSYRDFPAPEAELAAGRIWSRSAIETWVALHPDRKPGRSALIDLGLDRFTDRARRAFVLAQEEARGLNHNYLGCEHLLLGLVHEADGVAGRALAAMALGVADARGVVLRVIGTGPQTPEGNVPFTQRAANAIRLAHEVSLELGHNYVGTEHLLLGILREGDNVACLVLVEAGVDLVRLRLKVLEVMGFAQPRKASPTDQATNNELTAVLRRLDAIDERLSRIEERER